MALPCLPLRAPADSRATVYRSPLRAQRRTENTSGDMWGRASTLALSVSSSLACALEAFGRQSGSLPQGEPLPL